MIDRYSLSKMSRIWSDDHKMEIMLKIEVLSCEAMTKLGVIPKAAMDKIRKNAKFDLEEVRRLKNAPNMMWWLLSKTLVKAWGRKPSICTWG